MVEAARNGKPPPTDEQKILQMCLMLNCLPSQLENEDAFFLEHAMTYRSVYSAIKWRRNADGDLIHDAPEYVNDVLDMLDEMEIKYDGLT